MSSKKKILYLVSSYPYGVGETFVEGELKEVINSNQVDIFLSPMSTKGKKRDAISELNIYPTKKCNYDILIYVIQCIVYPIFWSEVSKLPKINVRLIRNLVLKFSHILKIKRQIKKIVVRNDIKVVYSFWNDVQSYACCLLKQEGLDFNLVSRVHGFDLYKEVQVENHMLFKNHLQYYVDKYVCLSEESKFYLMEEYNVSERNIEIIPLGISNIPKGIKIEKNNDEVRLLSCSFCTQNKNIDIIYTIVKIISKNNTNKKVTWIHIGDGPTLNSVQDMVAFDKVSNLTCEFLGYKTNKEIEKLYEDNYFDLFINASSSEGQPVSIMEAMSYGTPIIASDVGGIPSMLKETGSLVFNINSSNLEDSILRSLNRLLDDSSFRVNAHRKVIENFSSKKNTRKLLNLW
ncbi:glycosyltransferase [Vibrio sp. 10N.247.311.51]|uniref:glycosyltransferase n=1 Tax=Vibrio sp. 10N.247.311.51 TaxID=3229996 RepID=UPI003552AA1A